MTPCDRGLAGRIDVGHRDVVGSRERGRELGRQVAGARVEVRLEQHEEPRAGEALADRGDGRGDLGRVVAVVVDDRDALELVHLEAPAGAGEPGERRLGVAARHAGQLERRERRARVQPVQLARAAPSGPS